MNERLLKSKQVLFGDTTASFCEACGMTFQSYRNKVRKDKKQEFKPREIMFIIKRYNLTRDEVFDMFFEEVKDVCQ